MNSVELLDLYKSNSFNVSTEDEILNYYSTVSYDLVLLYGIELSTRLGIKPSIAHTIVDKYSSEHLIVISELYAIKFVLGFKDVDFDKEFINIINSSKPINCYIGLLISLNLTVKRKEFNTSLLKDINAKIRLEYSLPVLCSITGKVYDIGLKDFSIMYKKLLYSYIISSTRSCSAFYNAVKNLIKLMYSNYSRLDDYLEFLDSTCSVEHITNPDSSLYEMSKSNMVNILSSIAQLGNTVSIEDSLLAIVDCLATMLDSLTEQIYKKINDSRDEFLINLLKDDEDSNGDYSMDFSKYTKRRNMIISEYNNKFR